MTTFRTGCYGILAMACAVASIATVTGRATAAAEAPAQVAAAPAEAKPTSEPAAAVGNWSGKLSVGAVQLRLVLKVKLNADGALAATMDSVDQGANDLQVDTISLKEGVLTAELKRINGSYEGKLNAAADRLAGNWKQNGVTLPLDLEKSATEFKLVRPQHPTKPYPYREEEVSFPNAKANINLAGTLTTPTQGGPFAAVVLISGSGPQDRDESLMGHKPFLVLADHLTRQGLAVLRVDDRGVGKSSGDPTKATSVDFKEDVLAAVEFLKAQPQIDPRRIGLCGHSEGGLIAPLAAVDSSDVAFIVLMAGTGVPGNEIMVKQAELVIRSMGLADDVLERQLKMQREMFAVLMSETDPELARQKLNDVIEAGLTAEEKQQVEQNRAMAEQQLKMLQSPWFRYFLTYDPRPTLQKVRCPVLAINGEKDVQVSPSQNLPEIEKAIRAGGNRNVSVQEFPSLNHLFQTCQSGAVAEYGQIEETFSPVALNAISTWILERTKK